MEGQVLRTPVSAEFTDFFLQDINSLYYLGKLVLHHIAKSQGII